MKIKPLFDRVLVSPYKCKKSGLIITETVTSEKMQVLAVGDQTTTLKPNDFVLINRYAGNEFNIEGETYILIKETDILGVIEGENNE